LQTKIQFGKLKSTMAKNLFNTINKMVNMKHIALELEILLIPASGISILMELHITRKLMVNGEANSDTSPMMNTTLISKLLNMDIINT